jgi:hypothetical protein
MKINVSSAYWSMGKSSSLGNGRGRDSWLFLLASFKMVWRKYATKTKRRGERG